MFSRRVPPVINYYNDAATEKSNYGRDCSDRTIRLSDCEWHLLGGELSEAGDNSGRQANSAADVHAVAALVTGFAFSAASTSRHLRHFCRSWRLNRVYDRVHHHRLSVLPVRCRPAPESREVSLVRVNFSSAQRSASIISGISESSR